MYLLDAYIPKGSGRAKIRKIRHQIEYEADHRKPSKKCFTSISARLLRTPDLVVREY